MRYKIWMLTLLGALIVAAPSCNSGKVACPTYADSMPEKKRKGKPGSQKPDIPKARKPTSGILPPNAKHR